MPGRDVLSWTASVLLAFLLCQLCTLHAAVATSTNRTIDDENGDSVTGLKPTYGPAPGVDPNSTWIQGTTCVHCSLLPGKVVNVSQTFDGTWHDSTYHPGDPDHTINASFIGTAIYAYFIVPNFIQFTTTFVNLSFSVDGTHAGQYEHTPDNTSTILYHVLAFHTNLVNGSHTIEVRATGPTASIILFDNMIYTFEDADDAPTPQPTVSPAPPSPQSVSSPGPSNSPAAQSASHSSSPPIGAIAGGVAGGVAAIALLLLLYCYLRRRRRTLIQLPSWSKKPLMLPAFGPTARAPDAARMHPQPTQYSDNPEPARSPPTSWTTETPSTAPTTLPFASEDALSPHVPTNADSKETDAAHEMEVGTELEGSLSPASSSRSPSSYAGTSHTGTSTGSSALRAQVAGMREELERLRAERELHALFLEPPPRYEE